MSIVLLYPFLSFSEVLTRDIYISLTQPRSPSMDGLRTWWWEWGSEGGSESEQGGLALIRPSDCFSSSLAQRVPPPRNDD